LRSGGNGAGDSQSGQKYKCRKSFHRVSDGKF
jgi:hypothetical protein